MAKNVVTPAGIAKFPHFDKPDNYKGQEKYKGQVVISKADAAAFKKTHLDPFVAANQGTLQSKKPKLPLKPIEGSEDYSLSAKSDYKPTVVDSKKTPLPEDTRVGGGSKIRMAVELYAYDGGVSLRLKAVQVLELVEYGNSAAAAFDEVEDGFTASDDFAEETKGSTNDESDALEI